MVESPALPSSTQPPIEPSAMLRAAVHRFRPYRRQLHSHFLFEMSGETIAYCYIRKNACSAFKRMILDRVGYTGEWTDAIDFLIGHCSAPSIAAVRAARWRIFVGRDPFDRMASLFRNKMIMQDGAADFLRNYAEVTGSDPVEATFATFVGSYLARRPLDPHVRSQAAHLLPVRYNVVTSLETLFDDMKTVVGEAAARRYFAKPANRSSDSLFDESSVDVPVVTLRERYGRTRELPSTAALDSAELRAIVRRLYRKDYRLIERNSRRRNSNVSS